jgi:hypothetical protein
MLVGQNPEIQIAIIKPAVISSDDLEIFIHEFYISIPFTETLAVIISDYGIDILRLNAPIEKACEIEYPVGQNTVPLIKAAEHLEKSFIIKYGLMAYIAGYEFQP